MSCVTASIGSLYFVRWTKPEVADMELIAREVTSLHRTQGKLITYVAVAPDSSEPPDAPARKAMPGLMNRTLEHCEQMHIVMEGAGFKQSIMRSVMAAVFLAGGQRGRVHVHARIGDVTRMNASPELSHAIRILALRGLFSDPASGRFAAAPTALPPTG